MKERIVIPKDKIKVLTSCGRFPANGYFTFEKEDAEVKQVPETFDELKELCKDIKNISIYDNRIEIKINNNDYLYLHKNGHIYCMNEDSNISIGYDRTPQQMWQIIKSLIG